MQVVCVHESFVVYNVLGQTCHVGLALFFLKCLDAKL